MVNYDDADEKRISIHAPIKDATRGQRLHVNGNWISIHAPIKDATLLFLFHNL
jgi:hypothetical protein